MLCSANWGRFVGCIWESGKFLTVAAPIAIDVSGSNSAVPAFRCLNVVLGSVPKYFSSVSFFFLFYMPYLPKHSGI